MKSFVALFVVCAVACTKEDPVAVVPTAASAPPAATVEPPPAPPAPPAPPPPPPEETFGEKLMKKTSLAEAVSFLSSKMDDTVDKHSEGGVLLAAWSAKHMEWADVGVAVDETSYAKVQKDSEEERGKRMCVTGQIVQISIERTSIGKLNKGLLLSRSDKLYSFVGIKGSGELVQMSRARFCGVVIGNYMYHNSRGGVGHAVELVGMFDLPENKD